ncbi:hypothetical protein C1891_01555, partial [Pseudomonas sp. GW456-12-1-14-TSB6]
MTKPTPDAWLHEEVSGAINFDGETITVSNSTHLADPEFDMRGLAWNPLCDAATPLIGLVIRLRRLD